MLLDLLVPPPERRMLSEGLGKISSVVSERLPKNQGVQIWFAQLICLFPVLLQGCPPPSDLIAAV